ncbi:MAG: FMN-dependent NADH-azoreductase [Burkholderiales bacterium]|nr:FMN-dependent NADH-azoreductase [Burkholderiales bacterium]
MKLLHLDSSILGDSSASRQLTREIVDTLRASEANLQVSYRDLVANPIPHIAGSTLAANGTPAELRSPAQQVEAAESDNTMNDFMAADVLVIGAPMYNFSIPTQLKAWIDRVVVAGKTFKYGANGPEGLAGGKKVIIVSTAGGKHAGGPTGVGHEDLLMTVFRFIGITDITIVRAQGLAMGPESRDAAFADARATITEAVGTTA